MWNSRNIKTRAKSVWDKCLEAFFPRACAGCGKHLVGSGYCFVCEVCANRIDWIREPACTRCGAPFFGEMNEPGICSVCRDEPPGFDRCVALFQYRGMGARLVHTLKYERGIWLQVQIEQFIARESSVIEFLGGSVLVPIPLHWWKLHRRGYNQAVVIAMAIQRTVPGVEIDQCLTRNRGTGSQTFLTREERLKNMKNAFRCRKLGAADRHFVLVDDVLTTGATLNAAVAALKRAGASNISAFTLAHG